VATFDGLIGFVDKVEYVHDINIEVLEYIYIYIKSVNLFFSI